MKTILPLWATLLLLVYNSTFGAPASYKSKVTPSWYSKLTVYMEGTVAKVVREPIEKDTSIKQGIYNTTGLSWNDGNMTFPDSGTYWYIPFNNDPVAMMINEECWTCTEVYVCGSGDCGFQQAGECEVCDCGSTSDQTNPCQSQLMPCNGAGGSGSERHIYPGGGVIIKATNVNLIQVFYSKLIASGFSKITIQSDAPTVYFSRKPLDVVESDSGASIYNLTNLAWINSENGQLLEIPSKGNYWFIPFDPLDPSELQNGGSVETECVNISSCGNGTICDKRNQGGVLTCACEGGSTVSCQLRRCPKSTGGSPNRYIYGGGIIIEAANLVQN